MPFWVNPSAHLPISQIRRLVHVQALAAASATDENAIIVAFLRSDVPKKGQSEAQTLVNFVWQPSKR